MNKPTLTKLGGLYRLEWADEHIMIEVDRVSEHGDETRGQLTVLSTTNCNPLVLSQFSHNFGSLPARDKAAKHLAGYMEMEWKPVLEMVSYEILKHLRQGEPIIKVGNLPITEDEYRLYPFLQEQEPNMIYGPGGIGKTTLAAMFAVSVESGESRCGMRAVEGEPLWLDFEWSSKPVNNIAARLKDGLGLSPETEFNYRRCHQPLASDITAIQRMVLETGAKVLIVDSLGAACGGDANLPDVILRYFMALRSLGVTTLTIDHTAKENTGPYGSVYKSNCCRNVWEVIKGTPSEGNVRVLGIHHRKVNSGPLLKPWGLQFEYQPGSIIPKRVDIRTIPEVLAAMGLASQIEAALLRGPMTPAELAEDLGATAGTVSTTLSRHKGRFTRLGGGKWGNAVKGASNEVNQ